MSLHRPKQPELLRARILAATRDVLLSDGLHALTQERVLAQLDISKGGLQHHFRTKQQLLDGLFNDLFDGFARHFAATLAHEPPGPARCIRAYIRSAYDDSLEAQRNGRALMLFAVASDSYQQRWSQFLEQALAPDQLDPACLLACRLFADGLWFSQVLGPAANAPDVEAAIQTILTLTESTACRPTSRLA